MCPHTATYVSSYCSLCILIQAWRRISVAVVIRVTGAGKESSSNMCVMEQVEVGGYGRDAVGALTDEEFEMAFQDRMVQETNDARNKVEDYVYHFNVY